MEPDWAIAQALQSMVITQMVQLKRLDALLVHISDGIAETNRLLRGLVESECGSVVASRFKKEPWPGPCGVGDDG